MIHGSCPPPGGVARCFKYGGSAARICRTFASTARLAVRRGGIGSFHPAEGEDFDVDPRGKVSQGCHGGPNETGGGQEALVQREDLGLLKRVGRVMNLPPMELTAGGRVEE